MRIRKWILNEGVVDDRALFSNDLPNFGPGFIKLKDQNNDGVIDADNDRKVIGSVQAKHIGGFGLNAAWRGFDLAAMFNWSYGNKYIMPIRLWHPLIRIVNIIISEIL